MGHGSYTFKELHKVLLVLLVASYLKYILYKCLVDKGGYRGVKEGTTRMRGLDMYILEHTVKKPIATTLFSRKSINTLNT